MVDQLERHKTIVDHQLMLSGELRSPIMTWLMFLESLLIEQLSPAALHLVKIIISQVNLLLFLVNDILDFKMIEEKKFVSKRQVFSPCEVFNFVIDVFANQAKMQSTKIVFEESHILPPALGVDQL